MTRSRRKAREAALRALYSMEIAGLTAKDAGEDMKSNSDLPDDLKQFADGLVRNYAVHKKLIDEKVSSLIKEWDYRRVAVVDRCILRLAAVELFYEAGIPPAVTINEAIEIAKKYSTAESGKFVNGVLGNLLKDSPKAEWDPSMETRPEVNEEPPVVDPEPEEISEDEAKEIMRVGLWKVRESETSD